MDDESAFVIAGVLVLAILGISGDTMRRTAEGALAVRKRIRDAAREAGIDPDLLDALAHVETGGTYDLAATNLSGPDGARGGAWGIFQITLTTARSYGFTGAPEDLLDLDNSLHWGTLIFGSRPGGAPSTVEDAAAWWNAGKVSMDRVPATSTARTVYLPALVKAYNTVIGDLAGGVVS